MVDAACRGECAACGFAGAAGAGRGWADLMARATGRGEEDGRGVAGALGVGGGEGGEGFDEAGVGAAPDQVGGGAAEAQDFADEVEEGEEE